MFTSDDFDTITEDDNFGEDFYSTDDISSEYDTTSVDSDGDGIYETTIQGFDTDGDGTLDNFEVSRDLDNDGIIDDVSIAQGFDTDGNGQIDTVDIAVDIDNDGVVDAVANYGGENTGLADAYTPQDSEVSSDSEEDSLNVDDDIIGDPENDLDDWQQQTYEDSCSVVAEQSILNELTGENFSEDELRQEAIDNGWLTPGGGTTIDSVGNLLEAHGVDVEQKTGCSFEDITEQLEQGQNVMVAIDSDEIWNPGGFDGDDLVSLIPGIPEQGANHVVQVIGIDNSDPDNPMVIINDPGHPEGQGMTVSADQFMNAWEDSNQYMVHTTGNAVQENESADLDFGDRDIGLLGDYYDYDDPVEYSTSLGDYYANYSDSCAYQGYGEEASAYAGYATGAYDDAAWYAEHGY
jgi:hypothetical protein